MFHVYYFHILSLLFFIIIKVLLNNVFEKLI